MRLTLLAFFILAAATVACSGGGDGGRTDGASLTPSSSVNTGNLPGKRTTFYGADAGDGLSAILSGDFNGDGAIDIATGSAMADGPGNDREGSGEVYLFLGPFEEGSALDAGKGQYDAVFYGAAPGDNLGRTLAARDFNGDGVDDLVMAAPSANEQSGALYVMFGGAWPEVTDFASADPDVRLQGNAPTDLTGLALATGDLDGDGGADLLIGALLADGPQGTRTDAGEVYVLKGEQLLAGNELQLGTDAGIIHGAAAGDHFGEALATGDVNGDGKDDLILVGTFSAGRDGSRPGAGQTYVIDSPASLPIDLATASPQFSVLGTDPGDQLGHSVGAGDTDGDGAADIWLGAVSADGPGNKADLAGEAALALGGADETGIIDTAAGDAAALVYGPEAEARLGRSLAVGDLNADKRADLVISAPNMITRAGVVFCFFGGGSYPDSAADADFTLTGLDAGDTLGHESLGAPSLRLADLDGDGQPDLLLSAAGGDGPGNDRTDAGEAYVIPGSALTG